MKTTLKWKIHIKRMTNSLQILQERQGHMRCASRLTALCTDGALKARVITAGTSRRAKHAQSGSASVDGAKGVGQIGGCCDDFFF